MHKIRYATPPPLPRRHSKTLTTGLADEVLPRALVNAAPPKYNAMKIEMAKGLLASGLVKLMTSG